MAERVLALFGVGVGPSIPMKGREATAIIHGSLASDSLVRYHVHGKGKYDVLEFTEPGEYKLPAGESLMVETKGKSRAVLCFVRF